MRSARWVSCAGLAVLELPGVIEFNNHPPEVALVEQHHNRQGGGGEHTYSGVEEDGLHCADLRGAVAVGLNRDVGEAVDVFSVLVKMRFRCQRHSMSV